jgi:hypothetical protein
VLLLLSPLHARWATWAHAGAGCLPLLLLQLLLMMMEMMALHNFRRFHCCCRPEQTGADRL